MRQPIIKEIGEMRGNVSLVPPPLWVRHGDSNADSLAYPEALWTGGWRPSTPRPVWEILDPPLSDWSASPRY